MGLEVGNRVRRRSSGERGRIVGGPSAAGYLEVQFVDSDEWVPPSDLEPLDGGADAGPLHLLLAGKLGVAEEHDLYVRAAFLKHAFQYDSRSGLSNARIEPKLWQVFAMLRVMHRTQPRMILADEVGLGKTIEAGLVIKELRARDLADRVLVITPASLVEQWRHELVSKFNESFDVFDSSALEYLGRGRRDPWAERNSIICSLPFAVRHGDEILAHEWDLVIIDEAHKVSRRRSHGKWDTKKTYDFAVELKSATRGLLLLTATPMQVHESQLYSLVDLIEPGVFGSVTQFERVVRELPALNDLMKAVQGCATCEPSEWDTILGQHEETLHKLGFVPEDVLPRLGDAQSREALLTDLARRHPLADVMVRNRKREVLDGFQPRRPHTHVVEPTPLELELYEEISEYIRLSYNTAVKSKNRAVGFLMVAFQKMLTSSSAALKASFEKRIGVLERLLAGEEPTVKRRKKLSNEDIDDLRDAAELSEALDELLGAEFEDLEEQDFIAAVAKEIVELKGFVARLAGVQDAKAIQLVSAIAPLLEADPDERVLIFTQFIETQMFLVELLESHGFETEYFNGSMSLDQKERAVRRFRERSRVLVSTESGGEGRNFQFCHIMVNYDLPWNPMRVEQRIGRIDRIGQTRPVEIHNLVIQGTLEERVLEVLANRIRLFEESVGSLDPILGEIEKEFEQLAMSDDATAAAIERFEVSVEQKRRDALAKEEAQASLAMDRSSFRRDEANEWLQRTPLAEWSDLRDFVADALVYHGGRLSRDADGHTIIAVAPALKAEIRASRPRYQGEFNPALALVDEEDEFFAIGHEVVDGLMGLAAARDGRVCAAVSDPSIEHPEIEILYELLSRSGQPRGQLVRHRVSQDLTVRSEVVTSFANKRPPSRATEVPGWAAQAVEASRDYLESTDLSSFRQQADTALEEYRKRELERVTRIHKHTVERLEAERTQLQAFIEDLELRGTESQKKILPARQGALRKVTDRLERETTDYEREMEGLRHMVPSHSYSIVAATVVMPS